MKSFFLETGSLCVDDGLRCGVDGMFSVLLGLLRRKRNSFHSGRTFFGFLKTKSSLGDWEQTEAGGAGGATGSGSLTGLALDE